MPAGGTCMHHAAEYFAAGPRSFVDLVGSRSSQARCTRCRRPAANGVLIRGPHAEFLCFFFFAEWIFVTLLMQCHVALRT